MDALRRAIDLFGGQAGLAAILGLRQQNIWNWLNRSGSVPAEFCPAIERASRDKGQPILCEELRPDVAWGVLRDQHRIWPELIGTDGAPDVPVQPAAQEAA